MFNTRNKSGISKLPCSKQGGLDLRVNKHHTHINIATTMYLDTKIIYKNCTFNALNNLANSMQF